VWLLDESNQQCELWLAYVKDRLFTPPKGAVPKCADDGSGKIAFPCESMAVHLFEYGPGWQQTVEYSSSDERFPDPIRAFATEMDWQSTVATPLRLGERMLGRMTVCAAIGPRTRKPWGRVVLIEAIARQAPSRCITAVLSSTTASKSGGRPFSKSAIGWPGISTTTWRKVLPRS
jgi:hypothetical protein